MHKYSIVDPRWPGNLVGGLFFLGPIALVVCVWLTSVRPFSDQLLSQVFYYAVLFGLLGAAATTCVVGFTYRWSEISDDGLVVHEWYHGIIRKDRVVPKSTIAAVEQYDRVRRGAFTSVRCSGIRVRIVGDSDIVLAESDGEGQLRQEVERACEALGIPSNGQPCDATGHQSGTSSKGADKPFSP